MTQRGTTFQTIWVKKEHHLYIKYSLAKSPGEVGVDVREAVILSQGEEDAGWAAALTLTTEAAVANASTGRAFPVLERK